MVFLHLVVQVLSYMLLSVVYVKPYLILDEKGFLKECACLLPKMHIFPTLWWWIGLALV